MMGPFIHEACSECGDRRLVLRAIAGHWELTCGGGDHRWVPTPGTEIVISPGVREEYGFIDR
jgi:hypothetical protein